METLCMKCQILLSGKNKKEIKNITSLLSAEILPSAIKRKSLEVGNCQIQYFYVSDYCSEYGVCPV